MDRLQTLRCGLTASSLVLLLACGNRKESSSGEAPSARVVAVQAKENPNAGLSAFCDVLSNPNEAKPFTLPPLDRAWPQEQRGWKWVNIWATWCKPCLEEMPMLMQWREQLSKEGTGFNLRFVSVDAHAEDLTRYQSSHHEALESVRLTDSTALESWLLALGLDSGATIPIQVFVDAQNRVRCVRSGAINASDFDAVKSLLSSAP